MAVGKSEYIKGLANSKTEIIDLTGKLVTAGFNDAHIHFLSGSLGLTEVDMTGTSSPGEIAERVNQFIQANPSKQWITGRGWQYTSFVKGLPDHETLSSITNEIPVFIKAYDGHSAWANKKALSIAGITRDTKYSGFGEIVKDKNGDPTGTLRESAMDLVNQHVTKLTRAEKLDALRKGMKLAASLGITSIQNANGTAEDLSMIKELLNNGELSVRYAAAFSVNESTTDADVARFTQQLTAPSPCKAPWARYTLWNIYWPMVFHRWWPKECCASVQNVVLKSDYPSLHYPSFRMHGFASDTPDADVFFRYRFS